MTRRKTTKRTDDAVSGATIEPTEPAEQIAQTEDADDGYTEADFKRDFDTSTGECLKCGSFHLPGNCPADEAWDSASEERDEEQQRYQEEVDREQQHEWVAEHSNEDTREADAVALAQHYEDDATATEKPTKESAAAHLARVKQRLAVDAPLKPARADSIPTERLWIPGMDLIRPTRTAGMARSFELVAMMHPPSVAAPAPEVLAANPDAPYRVIAGRHRVLAALRRGEPDVFCHIYEGLSSAQEALLTLTENNTRAPAWVRDLESAAELINGHAQLSEDDLAFLLGRPVTTVRELVKIARLPESLLNQIYAGQITQATAKRLTRLSASARDHLSEQAAAGEVVTPDDVQHALKGQWEGIAAIFPESEAETAAAAEEVEQLHDQGEDTVTVATSSSDARALAEQLRALSIDAQRSSRVRALAGALCAELEG